MAKKIAPKKTEAVKKVVELMKKYPIVGALNMENLPGAQLIKMRKQLRDKVEIFLTKKRLIKLAFEQTKGEKQGIEKLQERFRGVPALIFTKENPFSLFKTIKKSKSKAAAKPGQTAPYDLKINAGPTPFGPGPIISEFAQLGVKTKVVEGKINVLEDSVIVREGEEVSENAASMLAKLGVEPMEIGLDLVAVYENGVVFGRDVLDIDEEQFMADLRQAASWAFNLSIEAGIITKDNAGFLVGKAYRESTALALSQDILADEVKEEVLAKAERQMQALKSTIKCEG